MLSVSSAFLAEVTRSHTAVTRVELWSGNQFIRYLYPTQGSIDVDARRAVRRSGSFTVVDEDGTLNPNQSGSFLTPFGSEVRVYRGVRYSDGSTEYVPLGVFVIVGVGIRLTENGTELDVQLEDRARVIQQKRYAFPYGIASGTNFSTALTTLATNRYPGITTDVPTTTYLTGGTRVLGLDDTTDPWSDLLSIAEAVGWEAYFSASGVFTATPIPSLTSSTPLVSFVEGSTSTLLGVRMNYSTADVYNGVIASAESTSVEVPLISTVYDTDPLSPTRYTGPLGVRPYNWSSSWIGIQPQLDDVASALLDTVRGFSVSLDIVPNPALDVRDIVQVTSSTIDLSTTLMIDTLRIPLSVDESMSITGRIRGY